MRISVIICSHNSRIDYLQRVLSALRAQTVQMSEWELVVVDNASAQPLDRRIDVAWHPASRIVREEMLGLAWARLRGINETQGDLLVFVDDDNVLDRDYLTQSLRIAMDWPQLGIWGGSVVPEFEVPPPEHLRPYLKYLALREIDRSHWSNVWHCQDSEPSGAGLCVRRNAASAYCQHYESSAIRVTDRRGSSMVSGGDTELAIVACSLGLGMGVFPELKVTHLIPKGRLTDDYMVKLLEGLSTSSMLLSYKWGGTVPKSPYTPTGLARLLKNYALRRGFERRAWLAGFRARIAARKQIRRSQAATQGGSLLAQPAQDV